MKTLSLVEKEVVHINLVKHRNIAEHVVKVSRIHVYSFCSQLLGK